MFKMLKKEFLYSLAFLLLCYGQVDASDKHKRSYSYDTGFETRDEHKGKHTKLEQVPSLEDPVDYLTFLDFLKKDQSPDKESFQEKKALIKKEIINGKKIFGDVADRTLFRDLYKGIEKACNERIEQISKEYQSLAQGSFQTHHHHSKEVTNDLNTFAILAKMLTTETTTMEKIMSVPSMPFHLQSQYHSVVPSYSAPLRDRLEDFSEEESQKKKTAIESLIQGKMRRSFIIEATREARDNIRAKRKRTEDKILAENKNLQEKEDEISSLMVLIEKCHDSLKVVEENATWARGLGSDRESGKMTFLYLQINAKFGEIVKYKVPPFYSISLRNFKEMLSWRALGKLPTLDQTASDQINVMCETLAASWS